MATSSYSAIRNWRSRLTPDVAHARAIEAVRLLGGELLESGNGDLRAKFGSRLSLRLWGLLTPKDLPAIMVVTFREDRNGLEIEASLASDEGWYLFRLNLLDDKFQTNFKTKLTAVQNATA